MSILLKDYFWIALANFLRLRRQTFQRQLTFSRKAYQFVRDRRIRLPPTYFCRLFFYSNRKIER